MIVFVRCVCNCVCECLCLQGYVCLCVRLWVSLFEFVRAGVSVYYAFVCEFVSFLECFEKEKCLCEHSKKRKRMLRK